VKGIAIESNLKFMKNVIHFLKIMNFNK
jgi:hypothetical protein